MPVGKPIPACQPVRCPINKGPAGPSSTSPLQQACELWSCVSLFLCILFPPLRFFPFPHYPSDSRPGATNTISTANLTLRDFFYDWLLARKRRRSSVAFCLTIIRFASWPVHTPQRNTSSLAQDNNTSICLSSVPERTSTGNCATSLSSRFQLALLSNPTSIH